MTTLWLAIAEAVRVEHLVYGRVSWRRIAREFQARGWDFRHLGADTARRLKWGYERWTRTLNLGGLHFVRGRPRHDRTAVASPAEFRALFGPR
jgi:hypothetical protein